MKYNIIPNSKFGYIKIINIMMSVGIKDVYV